jgi:SAM-dependent methyltransferase
MSDATPREQIRFACPTCKRPLRSGDHVLCCDACNRTYPIVGGIPDFLSQTSLASSTARIARAMDFFAPIYESRLLAAVLLNLSGVRGSAQFIDRIARLHAESLQGITGAVLDVACGPATYTRRLASPSRSVYGIDISMGVLQQGTAYVAREGITGVRLARARVEELPFADTVFDGAVCSGALHLFPDTVRSLREIARTLKPGAPLSVQTFIAGTTIINRLLQNRSWLHSFKLDELPPYLTEAGFEAFQPEVDGIVLTFRARKAMPPS